MKQVIDIRDMHTAIHKLYLVNAKPKTTIKAFQDIANSDDPNDACWLQFCWDFISSTCTELGDINFRDISGGQATRNGIPLDDCIYNDGHNRYKVIARFDVWG